MPILFVEPYGPTFAQTLEKVSGDASVQVVECTSSLDAVSVVRRVDACLIVCHAASADDFVKHITLLKLIQSQVQGRKARMLVTTSLKQAELLNKLNYHGVTEVLPEPISAKGLSFKLERHLKALPRLAEKPEAGAASTEKAETPARKGSVAAASATQAQAQAPVRAEPIGPTIKLQPSLALESDCWLLAGGGAKRIGQRWVVKLTGPGPNNGKWTQIEGGESKEHCWQWEPKGGEQDPFIKEEGAWVFCGQRPEFQEDVWLFIGKQPWLGFFYEGESYGYKLQTLSPMLLQVARDSKAALAYLPLIQKSLLKVIRQGDEGDGRAREERGARAEPIVAAGSTQPQVRTVAPLELESDCWLAQGRAPRKVGGRWAVKLLGPGYAAGRWKLIEDAEGQGEDQYWQWVPTDEATDPFVREEGAWVFRGLQPKMAGHEWVFVSRKPELAFYYAGESYGAKIAVEGISLLLAADSDSARARLELIEQSHEKVIRQESSEEDEGGHSSIVRDESVVIEAGADDGTEEGEGSLAEASDTAEPAPKPRATEIRAAEAEGGVYRYPETEFGQPGGSWEFVCASAEGGKWFVHVPLEIANGVITDARQYSPYWVYRGTARPEHVATAREWAFRDRIPRPVASFDELIKPIQSFLLDRVVAMYRSSDVVIAAGPGKSIAVDGPGPGTLLEGEFEAEARPDGGTLRFGRKKKRSAGAVTIETERREGTLLEYEGGEAPVGKRARAAVELAAEAGPLGSAMRGPDAVVAASPPGPSLSPMALAFLVSELMCRPGLDRRWMSQRFCAYLSASCGGLAIELWVRHEGEWLCAGTNDSTPPLQAGALDLADAGGKPALSPEGALVIPVRSRPESGAALTGAIVISGAGAEQVQESYARAAGKVACGLVQSIADTGLQGAVRRAG